MRLFEAAGGHFLIFTIRSDPSVYCQEAASSDKCDLMSVEAAGCQQFTDLK